MAVSVAMAGSILILAGIRGRVTVIVAFCETLPDLAVMVAAPPLTAVTSPCALTVATAGLSLSQVTAASGIGALLLS